VISVFNTDIEHDGVVYHVQTEDKGVRSAELMTLVYNGGTILASKRASYSDLASGDLDKDVLSDRLNRQHKLICAAIRAGRIDELTKMTRSAAAAKKAAKAPSAPLSVVSPPAEPVAMPISFDVLDTAATPPEPTPVGKPDFEDHFVDVPVVQEVSVVEEEFVLDPTAVAVVSELSSAERTPNDKLTIELFGEVRYKSGDIVTLNMMVCRGTSRRAVPAHS